MTPLSFRQDLLGQKGARYHVSELNLTENDLAVILLGNGLLVTIV